MTLERVRTDARQTFAQTVSGTDLIVGARTGALQLLLDSAFRLGGVTNTMQWSSAQAIGSHRAVAWWVPLSLGDSHQGYPVLATTAGYFDHFRYGRRQPLVMASGEAFAGAFDAVLGAEVARRLGYGLGEAITLSHGDGAFEDHEHDEQPFVVRGILRPTGTPVDRTIHVTLQGMEALHGDWVAGVRMPGLNVSALGGSTHDTTPRAITAMLVGLQSRATVFAVQRDVAAFRAEPLMAIVPGVALDELWRLVGGGERAMQMMTGFVGLVSVAGLVAVILAGLEPRRRELAILRAVGAGPRHMLQLLAAEAVLITLAGVALGLLTHWAAIAALGEWVQARFGVLLRLAFPDARELALMAAIVGCGLMAGLIPGYRAYRLSLVDGLAPRT
jgi:putative ABC transport system permease protein